MLHGKSMKTQLAIMNISEVKDELKKNSPRNEGLKNFFFFKIEKVF